MAWSRGIVTIDNCWEIVICRLPTFCQCSDVYGATHEDETRRL